jgi:hypothetical protein
MKLQLRLVCAAVLLIGCLGLVGCAQGSSETSDVDPVQVQAIAGSNIHRLVLTEEAESNLGIESVPVHGATLPSDSLTSVPMTAIIYDPSGVPWVYTSPAARTYVRTRVVIERTTSETAYLSSGPPVGTPVVTVGVSELLGSEYGVGGE